MESQKKRSRSRLFRIAKALITALVLFMTTWALVIGGIWVAALSVPEPGQTEAILVLGAQVLPNGKPNYILNSRLEKAWEVYQEHPQLIICCGAQGDNEPAPEGDVMRQWLINRGVPAENVLAETNSYNTYENIANAKALLPGGTKQVLIITSDFHLPRALVIAGDNGLDPSGSGSETYWKWRIKNHTREALAWGKYLIKKTLGRVH